MNQTEKRILISGIAYACAAILLQVVAVVLVMIAPTLNVYLLTSITEGIVLGIPGVLILFFWRDSYRPRSVGPWALLVVPIAIVGIFAITYLTSFWSMFLTSIGGGEPQANIPVPETSGQLWASIASFAIVPALCEELIFRGMLLPALGGRQRGVRLRGLALSSIAFALLHGNVTGVWGHLMIGLALGWLTLVSGSLLPAIIYHFVHNATLMFIAYGTTALLAETGIQEAPTGPGVIIFQAVFMVGLFIVFAALLLLFRHGMRKRRRSIPSGMAAYAGASPLDGAERVRWFAYIPLAVGLLLCALLYLVDGLTLFGADPVARLQEMMGLLAGA